MRTSDRVRRRKERHIVSKPDKLLGQPRYDALGATIKLRWHALGERCDLRNSHGSHRPTKLVHHEFSWRDGKRKAHILGSNYRPPLITEPGWYRRRTGTSCLDRSRGVSQPCRVHQRPDDRGATPLPPR